MARTASLPRPTVGGPRVGYMPGLDGLRGVAVAAVIAYHANKAWLPGGFLGVEVFFVISGYLITVLLIAERERDGSVALGQFWLRRARRLLPALGVTLLAVTLHAAVFARDELGQLRGDVVAGLSYIMNWFQIWTGSSYFSELDFVPLRHLWSLAVEEQFYVVWPLVVVAMLAWGGRRWSRLGGALLLGSVFVTVVMAVIYRSGPVGTPEQTPGQYLTLFGRDVARLDLVYLSTFTRGGGLLIGAALAMVWQPWALKRAPIARHGRLFDVLGVVGLAMLVLTHVALSDVIVGEDGRRGNDLLFRGGFFLVGVATVLVIACVSHPRTWLGGRLGLGNPLFTWVGTRSYGLYLYHWPIFQMSRGVAGLPLSATRFVVLMAITGAVAELSYRFVETPIRQGRLGPWVTGAIAALDATTLAARRRLIAAASAAVLLVAFSGVSLVTAEVTPNEIQESVEAGQSATVDLLQAQAGTTPTVPGTPVTSPTTIPGQPAPGDQVTTTTAAPVVIDVVAIGDSVMLGAAAQLRELGYVVDAEVSRQFKAGVDIVTYLNQTRVLGSVVIAHLGTNGPTSTATLDAFFEQVAQVPLVLVLTTRVDKPWQDPNNELIRAAPERWPNVLVLDWHALSDGQRDWFYGDNTHLRPAGARAYSELIAQAIGRA
jgi:peptidoglycan/LPS O-acetylase OafA/YrhL